MLWIALHFPLLSLETFAATLAGETSMQPLALVGTQRAAQRLVAVNPAARALGVEAGITRSSALALAPQLQLGQAEPARDAEALQAVAHVALGYTPNVSIPPACSAVEAVSADTVLLEVQPSLRYFGGLPALKSRLRTGLAPLGHRLHLVSAPTALGATLLARIHPECHCDGLVSLGVALDAAPVWLLGPGRTHWEALQGMGLHTLADLRALPRSGLARRFGEAVLDEFDRAFGHRPDPREAIALPPTFESRLELFARADTTEQVLHGAGLLLPRLVAWLAAQHAQARRFTLVMAHEPRWRAAQTPPATSLEIALAQPSRDAVHLLGLLRERLAQLELAAPTLELRLQCADIARLAPPNTELFPTPRGEREGLTRLIERLQARLGPAQVQRLRAVDDHRPERATEVLHAGAAVASAAGPVRTTRLHGAAGTPPPSPAGVEPSGRIAKPGASIRPVWLLTEPEPLQEEAAGPCLAGRPLRLLSGPERIESGWWDGDLAERDYYIAQDARGALVWIYRSRVLFSAPAKGWFLQGRFG